MSRSGQRICTRCKKALRPTQLLILPDGRAACERCARAMLPAEDFKRLRDSRLRYS